MNMVQPYPVHIPVHAPPPPNPPPNQQVVAAPMHANAPGRVCQWDGGICKVPIHDPTPRGVETHLRNYHFHNTPGRPWHRANRVACMWCVGGTAVCRWEVDCGSLGRHVSSMHLGHH